MWSTIWNDRKIDLVHFPGNLTAARVRDEILQPHLMDVINQQRELLQQNNAKPHTARVAMDYLEQNNINVLPWPSKSPDLNPIEHLWDELDKRVRQRQPPPQTLDQLRQILQQEWRTIPRNNVRNLIETMSRRWWSWTVLALTWPEVGWTVINCRSLLILWNMDCYLFSNKHSESISKSVTETFWFKCIKIPKIP